MKAAGEMGPGGNGTKGQSGMTIVMVLFFLVIAVIFGSVAFRKVKGDVNDTSQNVKTGKSRYVAEAAVYLGLSIIQGAPGFSCVTHDFDGITKATSSEACSKADLTKIKGIYSGAVTLDPETGWLSNTAADTGDALSGSASEKILVKIWKTKGDTTWVVGRATVNGITSDVQLFGVWGLP
jgi:hypothetical protein